MEIISNQQLLPTVILLDLKQLWVHVSPTKLCLTSVCRASFPLLCYLFASSTCRVEVLLRKKKKISFSRAPSIDIQVKKRARKLWAQVESARKFWLQEREKKVLSGLNRPEIWTIQKGPLETLVFVSYFRRLLYIFFSQILFQCFINSEDCK